MRVGKVIRRIFKSALLLGVIGFLIGTVPLIMNQNKAQLVESVVKIEEMIKPEFELEDSIEISLEGLSSVYALLVEAGSGRVIFEQKGSEIMYPASMTKVMTAIVAIEFLEELNQPLYLNPEIFPELYAQNAAMAGFVPGQMVPAIELLYGIMLPSGADSALGLSHGIAGNEENFVQLMNQKADELGMINTHFTNSIGLHHPNHYSTATDMVTLVRYALQNEAFKELFKTTTYTTSTGIVLESTLFSNIPTTIVENGNLIGGKTGFTTEAGRCLVSLAEINGEEYILVTAQAEDTEENRVQHLLDALYIYNQL